MENIKFEIDDDVSAKLPIPYFEEARAKFARYYTVGPDGTTESQVKLQIVDEISKLGGEILGFQKVIYDGRYGYMIKYHLRNAPGVIHVAGLPFKHKATDKKKVHARVQALCNVREWLKNAVSAEIFSPGCNILTSHLLMPGSTFDDPVTIVQHVMQEKEVPMLAAAAREQIIVER